MTLKHFCLFQTLFIALTFLSCNVSFDCAKYKNGKFYMYSAISKNKIIIERKDTLQFETDTGTGLVTKSKIDWTNPCEYKMTDISSNKTDKDGVDSFFSITPITVTIVSTGKGFYVFRTKVDSADKHVDISDTVRVAD
jgi:hypothetical protein